MAPTLDILRRIEANTPSLKFRFTEGAAGRSLSTRPIAVASSRWNMVDGTNSITKAGGAGLATALPGALKTIGPQIP